MKAPVAISDRESGRAAPAVPRPRRIVKRRSVRIGRHPATSEDKMQTALTSQPSVDFEGLVASESSGLCGFDAALKFILGVLGLRDPLPDRRQLSKAVRRCRHYQVAYCDVEELTRGYEIQSNRDEPTGNDIASNQGPSTQNDQARDDLDHANQVHERRRANRQKTLDCGTQIAWPVGKKVQELVESGKDGYKTESDPK